MQIHGPDGRVVKVNEENRLTAAAVTTHEDKHLNQEGKYWSAYAMETTVAVDDYFTHVKNTGLKDLYVTDIQVASSVALNTIYLEHVSGTASAGTDMQITNRNLGTPAEITGTVQHDPNFTGLTALGVVFFQKTDVANRHYHLRTSGNVIIPQGQAIAIRSSLAAAVEIILSISEAE